MNSTAQAFIAFLRCESIQAEERAKSLRATAAAIEANNLEGRRKKRKKEFATKPKKAHSAYTLFVHENYDTMKKSNPNIPSKDLISIMARQWAIMTDEEKQIYKIRAEQLKDQYMDPASLQQDASTEIDGIGLIEHSASDDNGGGKKKAAKKAGAKSPGSISVIIDV